WRARSRRVALDSSAVALSCVSRPAASAAASASATLGAWRLAYASLQARRAESVPIAAQASRLAGASRSWAVAAARARPRHRLMAGRVGREVIVIKGVLVGA